MGERASINNIVEELKKSKTGFANIKNDTLDNYLVDSYIAKTNTFKNVDVKSRLSSIN